MSDTEEYRFVCPGCGESIRVNAAMRDALTNNGCVLCGTSVSANAFTPL